MIQLNQIKKDFGKGEARQTILKGISLVCWMECMKGNIC